MAGLTLDTQCHWPYRAQRGLITRTRPRGKWTHEYRSDRMDGAGAGPSATSQTLEMAPDSSLVGKNAQARHVRLESELSSACVDHTSTSLEAARPCDKPPEYLLWSF